MNACTQCHERPVTGKAKYCGRCRYVRQEASRRAPKRPRGPQGANAPALVDAMLADATRARLARERATGVRTFTLTPEDVYAQREAMRYVESGGE